MVDSKPMEEEFQGAQAKMKATPRKLAYVDSDKEALAGSLARGFSDRFSLESSGTSDTHKQTRSAIKSRRTPFKNKELTHLRRSRRLEDQSITQEKARMEMSKPKGKRSGHQEISSDSEREEGSKDTYEDLNLPYKRPKPTLLTQRITLFKYHRRAKLPRNIRVCKGNKDQEDHLGGVARNLFEDLDPKSVDSFEELSQEFLEVFLQQKRYAKDPTEIYGIRRRQNEGLQAFMDRFKSESSHIKGVPLVLRISAFMHGHGHPELSKKLNDKIPKIVDEMFERVKAFIRGKVAAGSVEMFRPSQGDKGYVRPAWIGGPEKARNRGGLREARRNMGNNQRSENHRRNGVKIINMIREGGNRKRPYEEGRSSLTDELTFPAIPWEALWECIQLERVQGLWKEVQWRQHKELMSMIREQVILRTKNSSGRGPNSGPVLLKKHGIWKTQKKYSPSAINVWTNERLVLKEKVFRWLKEGMIRKVWHPVWVSNTIPVMLANGTWKVQVDYSSLNKVCAKDKYPFPEEGEGLTSIMGYSYKCFLIKELCGYTLEDDEEGLSQSKRTERGNKLRRNSNKKKKKGRNPNTRLLCKPTATWNGDMLHPNGKDGEQVQEMLDANERGMFNLNKKLQEKSTPTPRAWRLYLGKETIKEGSGVGIILVSPEERIHSYAVCLKFNTFDHAIDCEALLAGLAASVSKCMKDLHIFMDSSKLVA
nr:reverse transcriptase domain-containing protein [Tanacetum cinerariifolium]